MDRLNMHVVQGMRFEDSACCQRKSARCKNAFIFQNGPPHFYTLFSTTCGTLKKLGVGPIFGFLRSESGLLALFRIREAHFERVGVLSVSVVLPVSVESAMECQIRVSDVFCAVSALVIFLMVML